MAIRFFVCHALPPTQAICTHNSSLLLKGSDLFLQTTRDVQHHVVVNMTQPMLNMRLCYIQHTTQMHVLASDCSRLQTSLAFVLCSREHVPYRTNWRTIKTEFPLWMAGDSNLAKSACESSDPVKTKPIDGRRASCRKKASPTPDFHLIAQQD